MAKKILIVDDDKNLRMLYEQEFLEEGYEVRLADNGPAALKLIGEDRPDLVIMDIRMPGMDGLDATGKILGIDKNLPIVINSAYPSYKDNFKSWVADAYVVKSGNLAELKGKVRDLLATGSERLTKP